MNPIGDNKNTISSSYNISQNTYNRDSPNKKTNIVNEDKSFPLTQSNESPIKKLDKISYNINDKEKVNNIENVNEPKAGIRSSKGNTAINKGV